MKIQLAAIFIILFACAAFGQKILTVNELTVRTETFKKPKSYYIKSDKTTNLTSVVFGAEEPIRGALTYIYYGSSIGFSIGFDFSGQTLDKKVENYNLVFYFMDKNNLDLTKNQSISISADGRKFDINGGVFSDIQGIGIYGQKKKVRTLAFQIKGEDLQNISAAPKVEISLDGKDYKLNHKQQNVLKDIVTVSKLNT